jgi:hypothetical protein
MRTGQVQLARQLMALVVSIINSHRDRAGRGLRGHCYSTVTKQLHYAALALEAPLDLLGRAGAGCAEPRRVARYTKAIGFVRQAILRAVRQAEYRAMRDAYRKQPDSAQPDDWSTSEEFNP